MVKLIVDLWDKYRSYWVSSSDCAAGYFVSTWIDCPILGLMSFWIVIHPMFLESSLCLDYVKKTACATWTQECLHQLLGCLLTVGILRTVNKICHRMKIAMGNVLNWENLLSLHHRASMELLSFTVLSIIIQYIFPPKETHAVTMIPWNKPCDYPLFPYERGFVRV